MKKLPDDIAQQMAMLKAATKPTRRKGAILIFIDGVATLYDASTSELLFHGTEYQVRNWARERGYRIVKVMRS